MSKRGSFLKGRNQKTMHGHMPKVQKALFKKAENYDLKGNSQRIAPTLLKTIAEII